MQPSLLQKAFDEEFKCRKVSVRKWRMLWRHCDSLISGRRLVGLGGGSNNSCLPSKCTKVVPRTSHGCPSTWYRLLALRADVTTLTAWFGVFLQITCHSNVTTTVCTQPNLPASRTGRFNFGVDNYKTVEECVWCIVSHCMPSAAWRRPTHHFFIILGFVPFEFFFRFISLVN